MQNSKNKIQSQYFQQDQSQQLDVNDDNLLKILITTDNHLGFKEKDYERKQDSFDAFEESLQIGLDENVDFVLLGGDLFHEAYPSQETLINTFKIFQKHIFGIKDHKFSCDGLKSKNYENQNYNIKVPIFSIHGNHDYPYCNNDDSQLSILDLLQEGNYINYFGKLQNFENIVVQPLIFKKNNTRVAIYGIGFIRDQRLKYFFENGLIKFKQPDDDFQYFSILIIHQNRYKGNIVNQRNCMYPKDFPQFLNLVIWCHEHESIPNIELDAESQIYMYQPGSTIQTSLIEAEGKPKHAGILYIKQDSFYHKPMYLSRSNRVMLYENIDLNNFSNKNNQNDEDFAENVIQTKIEQLLTDFKQNKIKQQNQFYNLQKLPFLRIKIEFSGFDCMRIQKLESKYASQVANQGEILKFWKRSINKNNTNFDKNINLQEKNFVKCLKNIQNLDVLTTDSAGEMKQIFSEIIKDKEFKILNQNEFLDMIDNLQSNVFVQDYLQTQMDNIKEQYFDKFNQKFKEIDLNYRQEKKRLKELIENQQSNDDYKLNIQLQIENWKNNMNLEFKHIQPINTSELIQNNNQDFKDLKQDPQMIQNDFKSQIRKRKISVQEQQKQSSFKSYKKSSDQQFNLSIELNHEQQLQQNEKPRQFQENNQSNQKFDQSIQNFNPFNFF